MFEPSDCENIKGQNLRDIANVVNTQKCIPLNWHIKMSSGLKVRKLSMCIYTCMHRYIWPVWSFITYHSSVCLFEVIGKLPR